MSDPTNILLVEDHEDTLTTLRAILTRYGFNVIPAADVRTALELSSKSDYDMLLSDIGLPDGSGLVLLKELRKVKFVPAIALTGHFNKDSDQFYKLAGFDEVIAKPFSIHRVIDAIHALRHRTAAGTQ